MRRRAGSIVNLSSIVGVHGNWGQTNYAASKAGIIGFTKSLARELGIRGVRANVVAPGYVKTRLTEVIPEEAKEVMLQNTPLARLGEPEDVARGGTLPLLGRGLVHHGRGAARRRRTGDVGDAKRSRDGSSSPASGAVTPLGQRRRGVLGDARGRGVRRAARSRFSTRPTTRCTSPARRRTSIRPNGSTEERPAHGPLRAVDRRRGPPGRGRRRPRRRAGAGAGRRVGRDGHRRAQGVPGLLRHAARPRPRPRQPVLDPRDHPEHGRRLGLDGARDQGPAHPASAPPAPRRTWRSARGWTRSGSAAPT